MTGFGRSEIVNEDRKVVVEIKAVNHRYCDMNVKLPKKLNYFETTSGIPGWHGRCAVWPELLFLDSV